MSKKQNTKDPSGFIFDVQSNTVMAQGGTFENMKEKISAVRAIVPNRSNNEIVLVLQHFDNCVDKTVQAFMEGNASEVLKEWTVTGKKKNKKKKTKPKPQAESSPGLPDPGKLVSTEEEQSANSEKGGINGFHVNGCAHDTESVDSLSEGLDALSIDARELEDCESAAADMPDRTVPELENGIAGFDTKSLIMHPSQSPSSLRQRPEQRSASRSLSRSTASNSTPASLSVTRLEDVPVSPANKKLGSNIEKSVKDLQRCTVSLARYRVVVKEEMDASIKKMKQVFAELQSSLMDREVALLAEMDKVKAEAMEILVSRQKKAEALKKMTDVAVRMSEEQLVELRADIKHFVSERKYDEDLGRVARFTCDLDALKKSIASFGQVSHPKNSYSTRLRRSSVTAAAPSGPSETSAPSTPACASASAASLTTASKKPSSSAEAAVGNAGGRPPQPSREAFQGNRRAGAGPRSQGQRHIGPPGRSNNGNRHRTGPGQAHGRRQTSPMAASAGSPSQTQPTGTSGGAAQPGRPGAETKGLPQRKPRASRQEGANS
ncbi:spermatogenesis-associated serine-rich protein 2 isoform X2 [Gymnogyps californianus]|uniref:spermatogenesis-associated serine-rich protein 2 isoform X2 n=1 Tax=Gymnogyps californianus TaxID=33616 RepID=UPI0021C75F0E|nr:spermatogenesis-associated serine-rich protein 2 isoform X2 [Gymnogyps californianus]